MKSKLNILIPAATAVCVNPQAPSPSPMSRWLGDAATEADATSADHMSSDMTTTPPTKHVTKEQMTKTDHMAPEAQTGALHRT